LITGMIWSNRGPSHVGPHWFASPKVLLALGTWLVYAVVLHSPINPSFRGRKAAMLSIFGFVLMVAVMIAVQFMPQGASR
jgi:ABC-type transport system involved in cytochrome c biogenesis permease subunit